MRCPYCGSERIELSVAQVYSDLCLDCKSLVRSYIKEDTDKNWIHEPGSIGTR